MFSRVLFPALVEAGAGKQNAVLVIVVRRYASLLMVAELVLLYLPLVVRPYHYPARKICPHKLPDCPAVGA
jgi:hypothetical protein